AALDLIVSIGLLDSVNDLPGALLLMRRALKPGGLLLASFVGGGSGTTLRATLQDLEPDARRTHPLIDVRAGGDLLGRAGFTNIVADSDELTIRYPDLATLVADLRAAAATNLLIQRRIMTRRLYDALHARLDPGFTESLSLVTLTARAPL
ncbi:MAG: SAM-dependent methyltransferase, partial [Alphaproteobacteria bacterium]|nr:SAM-dependent methyltransferase [Alphaproteobacteria bacterium]